jgi:hypothetical protein
MDLSSPPDKALFWLYFLGDKADALFLSGEEAPFGLVISERTPGGISRLLWY